MEKTPAILANENYAAGYKQAMREHDRSFAVIERFNKEVANTPQWRLAMALLEMAEIASTRTRRTW